VEKFTINTIRDDEQKAKITTCCLLRSFFPLLSAREPPLSSPGSPHTTAPRAAPSSSTHRLRSILLQQQGTTDNLRTAELGAAICTEEVFRKQPVTNAYCFSNQLTKGPRLIKCIANSGTQFVIKDSWNSMWNYCKKKTDVVH